MLLRPEGYRAIHQFWSPAAISDLAALRAYIAQDDPAAAQRVALHIIRNVETLPPNSPEMGRDPSVASSANVCRRSMMA
jgi:plasmid stabilization system protein ParE